MKKNVFFKNVFPLICLFAILSSCKKDVINNPYDVLSKEYTNGIIKFSYSVPFTFVGASSLKDTIVQFTSIGNNIAEKDDYGYSKPSTPWVQLIRLNPNNFQNSTGIFFTGTDLNSLKLPYTFQQGSTQEALINYVIDSKPFYDSSGNVLYGTNTYAAITNSDNFKLTVVSKDNNRLQGTYSGIIRNQDGHTLNIKDGLFDIMIVEK